jgi:ABC-type uncharacterized transport system ATPase subunit
VNHVCNVDPFAHGLVAYSLTVTSPIVEIETVGRRFSAFAAAGSMTLAANAGEGFGLPGSNGAAKSMTMMPAWLMVIFHLPI